MKLLDKARKHSRGLITRYFPLTLFSASFLFCLASLQHGWNGTLCELHAFRQTQTAVTVSYLLKGGPWLAYETPIFGPPWSIPMEFPLYQWIVALVAQADIFSIDQSGRLVSALFFLSTLYPISRILGALKLSQNQIFLVLTVYCLSPQYLYWSRAFMIESAALALAVYFLWLTMLSGHPNNQSGKMKLLLFGVGLVGSLAGVVKVTTFFAFAAAALFFCLRNPIGNTRIKRDHWHQSFDTRLCIFAVVIPLVSIFLWTSYADHLKDLNPLGINITSSSLTNWNFGTLSQKFSFDTWRFIYLRTTRDLLGNFWLPPFFIIAGFLCRPAYVKIVFASLFLYLLPLVTFTNLYHEHNYYAYANGIFLLIAAGVIIADLCYSDSLPRRIAGLSLLVLVLVYSSTTYLNSYRPIQGRGHDLSAIARDFENLTREDEVVVVFGEDWSPEVPYYIQRRSVMIPDWLPLGIDQPYFGKIKQNIAQFKVGAVVFGTRRGALDQSFKVSVLSEFNVKTVLVKWYNRYSHPVEVYYND